MSYKPKGVEKENTQPLSINLPFYRFYHSEEDDYGTSSLNFSPNRWIKNSFPDYIAERQEINEDEEIWEVYHEETAVECLINSDHSSKEELAYKLENTYETLLEG